MLIHEGAVTSLVNCKNERGIALEVYRLLSSASNIVDNRDCNFNMPSKNSAVGELLAHLILEVYYSVDIYPCF